MFRRCNIDRIVEISALAAFAVLGSIASGCGNGRPATYPVEGSVRFEDGRPVPVGNVEFRSDEGGKIARGKIDQQGHFVLGTFCADDGAVAGLHHVIVVQSFDPILWDSGRLERPQDVSTGDDQPDRVEQDHEHEPMFVSRHFASYATSGLTVEVDPQRENVVELVVGQPVRGEEGVH
jgi:hypothetical protein